MGIAFRGRFGIPGLPVVVLSMVVLAACESALAQTCNDDITRAAGVCVQQTGLSNAAQCRQKAVQDCNCDPASDRCRGAATCGPELQAKARINVDWVFRDAGAHSTYGVHREMGESAFEAVVSAQAHNPPVQQLLRECRGWVEAYLGQNGGCTLDDHMPIADSCPCVSIVPTGQFDPTGAPFYKVSSACAGGLRVAAEFIDAAATGGPPAWGQPQLICPGQSFIVRAPQTFSIPSIAAYQLQGARGSYTCVCRDGSCS